MDLANQKKLILNSCKTFHMKSKLKNFSIELNFYKTPLENMVAIEFLSHMTTVLTHQNIL